MLFILCWAPPIQRTTRAWRSLPAQPRNPCQKEQTREERHLLQPVRRTGTSEGVHRRRRLLHHALSQRSADHVGPASLYVWCGQSGNFDTVLARCRIVDGRLRRAGAVRRRPAIAREVIDLLRDDTRRHAIRKNAYKLGREMVWSNVARLYMRSFELSQIEGRRDLENLSPRRRSTKSRGNCRS